ncbi:MAG: hypothetical protein LBN26_07740 [Christensenellaceae bacterium]|jgi:hypothetical protein|nr:hypothetical protein [Christensenellaceae bacterium]
MLYVYLAIVLCVVVFIFWSLFTEKKLFAQIDALLVLIPLLLRLLLIK